MTPELHGLGKTLSLREIMVILGAAAIIIPLFYRLKISPVLGYILSGVLLGPSGLGALANDFEFLRPFTIKESSTIKTMSDLGVMFLLFAIGLELSFERLKKMRTMIFTLGGLQLVLSTILIALICIFVFEVSKTASLIIGVGLGLSSTAIVMQILTEKKRISAPEGRASFGILLFQDIAIIPIIFAISFIVPERLGLGFMPFLKALVLSVLVVAAVIIVGRLVLRPLFRLAAAIDGPEIFMAASIMVLILTGLATSAAGLSMTLGAFLAGVLLAETEYRREVEATIQPFKGLLLGVFLVSVGMSVDIAKFFERPFAIIGGVAALISVKAIIIAGVGPFLGLKPRAALYAGILLGGAGEFAFVIIGLARELYIVGPRSADFALTVAAISMCVTPILAIILEKGGNKKAQIVGDLEKVGHETMHDVGHVIVAGYGRVGETVVDLLETHKVQYLAVDLDIKRVSEARDMGKRTYYGDFSKPEFMRACAFDTAKALVITMHGDSQVSAIVKAARQVRKDIPIVVRAKDADHAHRLYDLGANEAVPETLEASLQLGEAILVEAGVPMGNIIVSVHEKRANMRDEILESSTATTPSERLRVLREKPRT